MYVGIKKNLGSKNVCEYFPSYYMYSFFFFFQQPNKLSNLKPHPAEVVDQMCRGMFPLAFALCNIVYWMYYLYFTDTDFASVHRALRESKNV